MGKLANLTARAAARARRASQTARAGSLEQIREGVRADPNSIGPIAAGPTTDSSTQLLEEIESSAIEEQIEEREDILDDSGGSSEATEILGDEEEEELIAARNEILSDFLTELSADGFYQSLQPVYKSLDNASVVVQAKEKVSTSALIGATSYKSGRTFLKDYRAVTNFVAPQADSLTRRVIYSDSERIQITSKIVSSEKLNQAQLLQSIDAFLDAPQSPSFEGAIVTNRLESTKKLKLTSLPSDTPTTPTTESTTSPGSSY
jgi:hypothetical protein